ncbi:hypothetical protein pb186bvf_018146 [Paramecium bursaria]
MQLDFLMIQCYRIQIYYQYKEQLNIIITIYYMDEALKLKKIKIWYFTSLIIRFAILHDCINQILIQNLILYRSSHKIQIAFQVVFRLLIEDNRSIVIYEEPES